MRPLLLVLRLAVMAPALAFPLAAEVFVPPDQTKPLFARDLLPIDTDTMRALSAHLTDLARRDLRDQALQLRASAQLLAIAARLDPANRPARELSRRLAAGEQSQRTGDPQLHHALAQTWLILEWLLHPEAGPAGQLLGHQLLDALCVIDPRHPTSRRHDPDGERTRWDGVVADLARFAQEPPPSPSTVPDSPNDPPEPAPAPPPPPIHRPPILLRQTSVKSPLFLYDQDLKQDLRVTPISMEVRTNEDPGPLTFSLVPEFKSPLLDSARERVRNSLQRSWPDLPLRSLALLQCGGQRYASRNTTAISGPASLLLHAALSGRSLRTDLVFVGDLHPDGSLTRPRWSWDYLRALRSSDGGRLLVPPDLQSEIRAMIALENPGFFLKWEILVVSSLEAALRLASVDGDPEGLVAASGMFEEVRRVFEGKDVGQLCVNGHVRKRLAEILARAPFHYSASLLLLQGSGQRPIRVDPEVAARILRSAVEPLAYLTRAPLSNLGSKRIEDAAGSARTEVDRFAKYLRDDDSVLHTEALHLTRLAHSLARARRAARTDPDGNLTTPQGVTLSSLQQQLQIEFATFLRKLGPHTGETFPEAPATGPQKSKSENEGAKTKSGAKFASQRDGRA